MHSRRSFLFETWPRFAARHPWWVLGATGVALVTLVFAFGAFKGSYTDSFSFKGTDFQTIISKEVTGDGRVHLVAGSSD